jgi:hypothetical protein
MRSLRVPLLGIALAFVAGVTAAPASAQDWFADEEEDKGPLSLGGNLKTFAVGTFPYEHFFMPEDPIISGLASSRLKLEMKAGELLDVTVHPLFAAGTAGGAAGSGGFTQLGVGAARPEAFDLSWNLAESELGSLQMIIDRAQVALHMPNLDVTLGRQPVSFGQGYFFTPMDLVAPFSPATIDREYKPGVDALRLDFFFGTGGQITAVVAYAGGWDVDQMVFAGHARMNVLGTDVGAFAAEAHGDTVVGLDIATDALGLSLRGEATATFPDNDTDDAFLRAVAGADVFAAEGLTVSAEIYAQTNGADDPEEYLALATSERFERGELWLMGQLYGAASVSWELTPLLRPAAFGLVNLRDGSFMVGPSLAWSVSDEVDVNFGAQLSQGERPVDVDPMQLIGDDGAPLGADEITDLFVPRSEFGLYPHVAFAQVRVYF